MVGALNGVVATLAGGGAVSAPVFWMHGPLRQCFVATKSSVALVVNIIKTSVSGVLVMTSLLAAARAGLGIPLGNRLGRTILQKISDRIFEVLMLSMLTVVANGPDVAGVRMSASPRNGPVPEMGDTRLPTLDSTEGTSVCRPIE